jgi:protein-S-isoprenylcysteine O-methyltransferase Ste14
MPTHGLYRLTRNPIYLGFALILWTMPVWSADQLALAIPWTAYCAFAPRLKERRFAAIHGDRFRAYRARVPYWLPLPRKPRRTP